MNLEVPEVALEFAQEASLAMHARGGVELARRAFFDPAVRDTEVGPLLEALGIGDLEQADDLESLMAAAELCRAAGTVALPYPVAARLAGSSQPVAVVDPARPRADHAWVFERWLVIDLGGRATAFAEPGDAELRSRLGHFVADLATGPWRADQVGVARAAARVLTFQSATALGACEQAFRLTVDHVRQRRQFGQPLAGFQSVRFRLAELSTALAGLGELTRYTVVRLADGDEAALVDVLGLRLQTVTVSRRVLRASQQLHGATAFCNEYDLSVLTRYLQPLTRLPMDRPGTVAHLLAAVDRYGFDATLPVPPLATITTQASVSEHGDVAHTR